MPIGEGGHPNAELPTSADQFDQFGGIGQAVWVGLPGHRWAARHVAANGQDIAHPCIAIKIDDPFQLIDGREQVNGPEQMRQLERMVLLQILDTLWKEHLLQMDRLKEGIGLRGYGQKNPLLEYKKEGYNLFAKLMQELFVC